MYSLGNNKPLIGRENNYVLDRKLVTVHSEDRDITKWINSNQFEITLPESILNVQSLRLVEVGMPSNFYTFSDNYKNTQLSFQYDGTGIKNIKIGEGTYPPILLANELEYRLNTINTGTNIHVYYDNISQKYFFGTDVDIDFELLFKDGSHNYVNTDISCNNSNISSNHSIDERYSDWGLGYYLGFDKDNYKSQNVPIGTNNKLVNKWIVEKNIKKYIQTPYKQDVMGEKCIYMEVEKYNSMDEIYPYTETSKDMYNHTGISGKVNSAFAKIPINADYNQTLFNSRNISLQNITHYEPPIERISKLKFTFRFHDGRYVDFQNNKFNFTLEFNSLKNEIGRSYNVRIPQTYLL